MALFCYHDLEEAHRKAMKGLWKSNINKTLCPFSVENIGNNSNRPNDDQFECITDELTRMPKYIFQENTMPFLQKYR
jgi:hypothetical protein